MSWLNTHGDVFSTAPLLDRERELRELQRALVEARDEKGQLLLIEGSAGLGKTSLLRASFDAAAAMGFTVMRARASELERDFPYGCVRQLLEPVVLRAAAAERERLFDGAAALAMPLFAPRAPAQSEASADSAFSVLHGLYWLLNNLTRAKPVALCVDDLQWSDTASLRFLGYLAPRLDGLALAVLATVRSHENVTPDLAHLSGAPETKILRPQPLSLAACATLCERRLGSSADEDFAAACHGATGGNPFYLETLLREAQDRRFVSETREAARVRRFGPGAVARAVLLRLSSAPASATTFVRAIAVLGNGASVTEAARLAELPEEEAAHVADLLVTLSIFKQSEGLEFAHPIVRQAVYDDIGTHARARAHARAAQILIDGGASDERVATQLAQAEPAGDASRVDLLRRVAAGALSRGAPAAAVSWLKRALGEPPSSGARAEVQLELGSAQLRLAMPEAVEHLRAAVADLREPRLVSFGARQLANAFAATGNADQAIDVLESAIAIVQGQDTELSLVLEAEFAAKAQQAGGEVRARARARLARHEHLAGNSPGERLVLASLAFERARASEKASDAVGHIERALTEGGWFSERQPDVIGPFYALVISLLATDALDLGRRYLERALLQARARASVPAIAFLTAHRGWFFLRAGAVAEAEADAREALDLLSAHKIRLGKHFALALLLETLIENGQLDAAETALRENALDAQIPAGLAHNPLLEARGVLRIARGDTRAGFEDLIEFGRRDELWGGANPLASRWRSRACRALAALGEIGAARRMAAEELDRAKRWGAASSVGVALRARALVAAGAGPASADGLGASASDSSVTSTPPTAESAGGAGTGVAPANMAATVTDADVTHLLRESADALRDSPAKLEYARTLTELGAALRRANRRADARGFLNDAIDLARRSGAAALVERATVELRIAGGRSSEAAANGADTLTVSERRVAELAAQGHSNPKIAQALFVTRKTIETHLGHIYAKLGIASRAELTRALAGDPQNPQR
jgi:DNA-binding CsgD family transcriptional regulator